MAIRKRSTKLIIILAAIAAMLISSGVFKLVNGESDKLYTDAGLRADTTAVQGKMYVNFISVGQGDSTLITCGDTAILIDGGEKGEAQTVINYLKNHNVEDIDCMIATHPHSDHIGSLGEIVTQFEVKELIMPEIPKKIVPTTATYKNFLKAVNENVDNVIAAKAGSTYSFGEITVDILAPITNYDELNDMSVVSKITFGKTSVMMTGDAASDSEKDMLLKKTDYKSDLLKVAHHGSRTSTSDKWLDAVKPKYAVISCGLDNDYGHPHKELIKRLEKHSVEYFRTDLLGDIVFESDGKTISKVA